MGSFASARVTSSAVGGSWDEVTPRAKAITAAVAALAVVGIVKLRFCGDLTLPEKPPAPLARTGDLNQALAGTAANDDTWRMFLTRDAASAGLGKIDPADMTRVFPYQGDSARHVLAPGESIELAGLKLTASAESIEGQRTLVLTIDNPGPQAVAYQVRTDTSQGTGQCAARKIIWHNAIVVGARGQIRRSECKYADGMLLVVTAVDAMTVPPLGAHYINQAGPSALALDERATVGHEAPGGACKIVPWAALTSAVEAGAIRFRDLADFYARHRCMSYKFPMDYKCFERDAERPLPAWAP